MARQKVALEKLPTWAKSNGYKMGLTERKTALKTARDIQTMLRIGRVSVAIHWFVWFSYTGNSSAR
jgi:hypothetical protein